MKNHVRLGVLGKGTVRIRFEPVQPSRYIVNCAREEIIGTVRPDTFLNNGKLTTEMLLVIFEFL